MKKFPSITILFLVIALGLYHSLYFENLDTRKEREKVKSFNPQDKVNYFWENKLDEILESSLNLTDFDIRLKNSPDALVKDYGHAVGITSSYSFLVKGTTRKTGDNKNLIVDIPNSPNTYILKTKFIFGNTVRDALNYFSIDDFENTMDFNAIASELNSRITATHLSKLDSLETGTIIKFVGALSVNVDNVDKSIEIIPIKILTNDE